MKLDLTPVEAGLLRELLKGTIIEIEAMAEFADSRRAVKNRKYYEAKASGYNNILNKITNTWKRKESKS